MITNTYSQSLRPSSWEQYWDMYLGYSQIGQVTGNFSIISSQFALSFLTWSWTLIQEVIIVPCICCFFTIFFIFSTLNVARHNTFLLSLPRVRVLHPTQLVRSPVRPEKCSIGGGGKVGTVLLGFPFLWESRDVVAVVVDVLGYFAAWK